MPPDTSAQRITELEISMTHLQRDYDALHEVLLSQQKTIDGLKRKLERLESRVDGVADPEIRDAEAEKPPHY